MDLLKKYVVAIAVKKESKKILSGRLGATKNQTDRIRSRHSCL